MTVLADLCFWVRLNWYVTSSLLPAVRAHPRKAQRHRSMDIYTSRHWFLLVFDTVPKYLSLNDLLLDLGLVDDHGLKVHPLGDLSLELCDNGGNVRDVLYVRALVPVMISEHVMNPPRV